jgi:anaerobic selenocysteine-containing dehydrogenase
VKALDDGFFAGVVGMVSAQPGSAIHGRAPEEIAAAYDSGGPERILDFQIRVGPWGDAYGGNPGGLTLEEMKAHPEGVDMGPLEPYVREILATPSGKIELAPPYIVGDLDRLAARLGAPPSGMVLTSRRQLKSNNSWMHNVPTLVRGSNRCTLLVHPADAARLRLLDGEPAQVTSSAGSLVVPVQVSKEMMPGVVSLPHGWGHDRDGTRTAVASGHAGVNSNLLSPGDFVDVISGNAAVNGIPVEIVPVPA